MSAPDRFIAWCKQRASIQQQLELIVKHPSRGGARAAWRPIKKARQRTGAGKKKGPADSRSEEDRASTSPAFKMQTVSWLPG